MALDTGRPLHDKPIRHLARRHRGWRALSALFDNGRVLPAAGKRPNPADAGALRAQKMSMSLAFGTCLNSRHISYASYSPNGNRRSTDK
jgi:hypothetical protein